MYHFVLVIHTHIVIDVHLQSLLRVKKTDSECKWTKDGCCIHPKEIYVKDWFNKTLTSEYFILPQLQWVISERWVHPKRFMSVFCIFCPVFHFMYLVRRKIYKTPVGNWRFTANEIGIVNSKPGFSPNAMFCSVSSWIRK